MSDEGTRPGIDGISPVMRWMFYLAAAVVILGGLRFAAGIVGPTILALVIVLGTLPVQTWLIERGWKPILAFSATLILVLVVLGALFLIVGIGMGQFIASLPQYKPEIAKMQAQITHTLKSAGIDVSGAMKSTSSDQVVSAATAVAQWVLGLVGALGLAITLFAFMLFDALTFTKRLDVVAGTGSTDKVLGFVSDVQQWVTITALVNFLVAAFNTVFLWAIGIPYALLWGVLSFILGFIPNVGFLLSLVPPTFLALVQYGPEKALLVIVVFILINGGVQNFVTPRMMGEGLDLSVFVVIFSLIFWGFLLGAIGGLMAIPLTLVLRMGLETSHDTVRVAYLLGGGQRPFVEPE